MPVCLLASHTHSNTRYLIKCPIFYPIAPLQKYLVGCSISQQGPAKTIFELLLWGDFSFFDLIINLRLMAIGAYRGGLQANSEYHSYFGCVEIKKGLEMSAHLNYRIFKWRAISRYLRIGCKKPLPSRMIFRTAAISFCSAHSKLAKMFLDLAPSVPF